MAWERWINQTVTVSRATVAIGASSGSEVSTWADEATTITASVQANTSLEAERAFRASGLRQFTVYARPEVDVRVTDRLKFTDPNDSTATLEAEVIGPPIDRVYRQRIIEIPAQEVDVGGTR